MLPRASKAVADSCRVMPISTGSMPGSAISTRSTSGSTVIAAALDTPSETAVLSAEPGVRPVTTPSSTIATSSSLLDHVTSRSSGLASSSIGVATRVTVPPTGMSASIGSSPTSKTEAMIGRAVHPSIASTEAVTVTSPTSSPVSTPSSSMLARLGGSVLHSTSSCTVWPCTSTMVAVMIVVSPV